MKNRILTIFFVLSALMVFLAFGLGYGLPISLRFKPGGTLNAYRHINLVREAILQAPRPSLKPSPSPTTTKSPVTKKVLPSEPADTSDLEEWGVAKEIGEGTYTIKLAEDDSMGTPSEIHESLNSYRNMHGKSSLQWNDTLASFAQTRAEHFKSIQSTDGHAGLNSFLEGEDGFTKLGFAQIGENSYFGGPLYAVHIIEWLFAASEGHNTNQLDNSWSHVGVGVTDTSVNLIFAGQQL